MKQILSLLFLLAWLPAFTQTNPASPEQLISRMTIEEKAKIVTGVGMNFPGVASDNKSGTKEKVPGAAGNTFAIPRLGIPSIVLSDGPAGVRIEPIRNNDSSKTFYATSWPVGTLLASSWDTALVKKVGAAFGREVRNYGIDVILAPAQNIQRNPLNGRNFEYYSEDPLLSGTISAAMVEGIQSNGVGVSIKHFAANNQETNRLSIDENISQRALREIYLKNFEITVKKAHPWTVMSSYNKINGTYTSQSYDLLTTILRKEWGYKGLVMTDWFGGNDAVAQMIAYNNLLMPGTPAQTNAILKAVRDGNLEEKVLDKNVEKVLELVYKSPTYKKYKYNDKPDLKSDAALSREASTEGMVLLKNDFKTLPLLGHSRKIALFGINGYHLIPGGTGSGQVNTAYNISLDEGLSKAGFNLNADLKTLYANYLSEEEAKRPKRSIVEQFINPQPPIPEMQVKTELIDKLSGESEVAIVSIGRNAGEGHDRKVDGDFNLTDPEKLLIKEVANAFHAKNKKVVVVLNIDGVIETASWRDFPDAILLAWQPGLEGGDAITDILSGKVNPSGKIAQTFPLSYNDVPSSKSFPGKEFPDRAVSGVLGMKIIPAETTYDDDIYVGYRYYTSYGVKTAFPFGYGMSYTTFSYSNLKLSSATFNGKLNVSFTVTNTGKVAGKEVAQLYLSAPSDKINKPAEELKGFAKTKLLQPGKSEIIHFTLSAGDLASFKTDQSAWIADAGKYQIKIGASSEDIKLTDSFELPGEITVEKVHDVLKPKTRIDVMKGK